MIQHHKWSLTEIEDMMPYEREIYVTLLTNWVAEENERIKQQMSSYEGMNKLAQLEGELTSKLNKSTSRKITKLLKLYP